MIDNFHSFFEKGFYAFAGLLSSALTCVFMMHVKNDKEFRNLAHKRLNKINDDVSKHKTHVAENYAVKGEIQRVNEKLDNITDILLRK